MATKEELHAKLKDGVVEYGEDTVKDASKAVLEEGFDPLDAIMNGLAAGMEKVGELYEAQEYFVMFTI